MDPSFKFTPQMSEELKERCSFETTFDEVQAGKLPLNDHWLKERIQTGAKIIGPSLCLKTVPLYDVLGKNILKMDEDTFETHLDRTLEQNPTLAWKVHIYNFTELCPPTELKICTLFEFVDIMAALLMLLDQQGKLDSGNNFPIVVQRLLHSGWNALTDYSFRNLFTIGVFQQLRPEWEPTLGKIMIHYFAVDNTYSSTWNIRGIEKDSLEANFILNHLTTLSTMSHLFEDKDELKDLIKAVLNQESLSEFKDELQTLFSQIRKRHLDNPFNDFFHNTPLHTHEIVACVYICSTLYYTDEKRKTNSPRLFVFCKMAMQGWAAFKDPEFRRFFCEWQAPSNECMQEPRKRPKKTAPALQDPIFYDSLSSYLQVVDVDPKAEPQKLHEQFADAMLSYLRSRSGKGAEISDSHRNMLLSVMNSRFGHIADVKNYITGKIL